MKDFSLESILEQQFGFASCQSLIDFSGIVPVCTVWVFGSASDCTDLFSHFI